VSENTYVRIYYDWLEHIAPLSDHEFREVINAAAEYSRHGTEPPEMDGMAGMAMRFMLSDMRRLRIKAESGRAGGKKRAENVSASRMLEAHLKQPSSILQHYDYDYDKDLNKDYDDDGDYDYNGADAPQPPTPPEEVLEMFKRLCPSLVQPRGITEKLRADIAGCPAKSREELAKLFRRAQSVPFLGGGGEKGWRAPLSWVLSHAEEITAGEYDDFEKPPAIAPVEDAPEDWAEQWNKVNRYGGVQT